MPKTLTFTGVLHILTCGVCSIPHAIPEEMYKDRLDNGGEWYCPNGHNLHFVTTESQKLKEEAARLRTRLSYAESGRQAARDQAHAAELSARAYKGHVTRLRNRIASGVCPVDGCRRNFSNVKGHIERMHPQWAHEHPDALA